MNFRLYSENIETTAYALCSIIEFTSDSSKISHGDDTLDVLINPSSKRLVVRSKAGTIKENMPIIVEVDKTMNLRVSQRYVSNGQYRYSVDIDGINIATKLVTNAQQYYNIDVYAAERHRGACPAFISNFKLTNFL